MRRGLAGRGDWGLMRGMMTIRNLFFLAVLSPFAPGCGGLVRGQDFAHEVAPVLKQYCADCHLGEKKKGGLSMNTREALLEGSENGAVVDPGKAGGKLISLLRSADSDDQMPPKGDRVPEEKIAVLEKWVLAGMPWEAGFTFGKTGYEPPLRPRQVTLPPVVEGRENPVDRIADGYFASHGVKRPGRSGDAAFLRRVRMDLTGLLPGEQEARDFLASAAPEKRSAAIRRLLHERNEEYAEHWITFWNDLLRNDYAGTGYIDGGRKQITAWLYQALLANMPYDQFARELLAPPDGGSEGFINGIKWRGNVNASQVREVQFSQSISQVFLGINMKCASCHDSFIDRWKLDEAYGLAAVFADQPLEINRCDKPMGRMAQSSWIFPELGNIDAKAPKPERLKQLAGLMIHPENGRFTRTMVNRIWHRMMGRGIVHPVDAMHTEPWSADLLDWLAVWFAEQKYDVKKLIALIAESEIYQAQCISAEKEESPYVFRGPLARKLTAEQFVDAVWQLTGTAPKEANKSIPRTSGAGSPPLQGKWIWSRANASAGAPAGERVVLRHRWESAHAMAAGTAVISCDNGAEVFVNGVSAGTAENWEAPATLNIPALPAGKHTIQIIATNGGSGPNPAGLFFEALLPAQEAGRAPVAIASSAKWEWAAPGTGSPALPASDAAWKSAAAVANQNTWAAAMPAMQSALATGPGRPVRAALVTSDLLQRALGRPNREQITSMRPDNLTTLEAIDLANGQILSGLLQRGGPHLLGSWKGTPEQLAESLVWRTLSRAPEPGERAVLAETLGSSPTAQHVEDALWLVLMLPEFQFVR